MYSNDTAAVVVTDATFAQEIEGHTGVAVVDVGAEWCGPCRAIAPVIDKVAQDWRGKVKVATVDADLNPGIGSRFRVRSIPTLLLFRDGQHVDTLIGADPRLERILTERVQRLGAGV
jgi:thioredoxin